MSGQQDCGCGSNKISILIVLAALFFAVVAGAFLAGAAAFAVLALAPAGPAGWPAAALMLPALLMLGAVLLLLLFLLWCCCGGKGRLPLPDFGKLFPMLRTALEGLGKAATALDLMATELRTAKGPVDWAGSAMQDAGDKVDVAIPTVSPKTTDIHIGTRQLTVVTGLSYDTTSLFGEAKTNLRTAGGYLTGPDSLSWRLEQIAVQCNAAASGLREVKNLVDAVLPPG